MTSGLTDGLKGMVNTMPKRLVLYSAIIGGGVGAYILWRRRKTAEEEPTDEATGPSAIETERGPYRGGDEPRELPYAPGVDDSDSEDRPPGSVVNIAPVFNLPPGTTGGGPDNKTGARENTKPAPDAGAPQKAIPLTQSELAWLAKYDNEPAKKLTNAQRLRRTRLREKFATYNKYALAAAKAQVAKPGSGSN